MCRCVCVHDSFEEGKNRAMVCTLKCRNMSEISTVQPRPYNRKTRSPFSIRPDSRINDLTSHLLPFSFNVIFLMLNI